MNKRVVIVSVLSLLVVFAWYLGNMKLRQLHPEWYQEPKPEQPAGQTDNAALPGTQPATQAVMPATTVVTVAATTQPGGVLAGGILVVGGDGKSIGIGSNQFDPAGT